MTSTVAVPLWLLVLIVLFAAVTFASHFLFPSVRWFFRRRLERAVDRLNQRLVRPIEPFKLARRYDMIQRLIYDPEVSKAIAAYATKSKVPENVAFEKARRYAREIVPSFSAFAYFGFAIRAARLIANALYEVRTGPENESHHAGIRGDSTVVFVMIRRSNMDYVLVTYLAAQSSALSYAVGEWARVWPLSRLIKSMGAYFIRRKSRGALYRRVLARYVELATEGGVTQAIFPEGGLSLNGKLMPPKMGILTYVVGAQLAEGRDVVFVPVAINYDRVLEDRVLIAADMAGRRRFGARLSVVLRFIATKIWLRMRGRFHRFGSAAVVFGTPVALSNYGPNPDITMLAKDLMARINQQMPVLGVPSAARLILEAKAPISAAALIAQMQVMNAQSDASILPPDSISVIAEQSLEHMAQRGMIVKTGSGWAANGDEISALSFYANSIEHLF